MERHVSGKPFANLLGRDGLAAFLDNARNGRADRFLAFLENELHPEIQQRYRVGGQTAALYGHSQAGLFVLYALTAPSRLFTVYGAGSPAIVADGSRIYERYRRLLPDGGSGGREVRLHLVANDEELTGTIAYYRYIGLGLLKFVELTRSEPLRDLRLTTDITKGENHFSGVFDAYRSFLRACFST